MCPPPDHYNFWQKLKHDFKNSYYQVVMLYIACAVTGNGVLLYIDMHLKRCG